MTKKYISYGEMNRITESVLAGANIPTVWQGFVNKVDIDALIEFDYDLEIAWKDIDYLAPGETVFAAITPKHKRIYMNETKKTLFMEKMGTMNFSKAHELGHWILHITEQNAYEQLTFEEHETFFCRSALKKPLQEIQADMFAACLLMPKDIIAGVINELKQRGQVTFPDLYRLSGEFEVSISALTIRVQELKLLCIADKMIYHSEAEAMGQLSLL
ncbi:MAG: ImmA/IrrE family metallo-endopeptidase [Defluviitaleaceae bacterium]|nr:ImmA/IrrE family metallo-endopeptidase [Defluviitaleaceae bacterium]